MGTTDQALRKPLTPVQHAAMILAHVFAAASVVLAVVWAMDGNTDEKFLGGLNWDSLVFNWHPVLMVSGFVLAYTEAILAYRTFPFGKAINKALHGLWHSIAVVCVSVGVAAAFQSHNTVAGGGYTANLYSLHSWMGIATLLLFGQQYLAGFVIFGLGLPEQTRSRYLPYHVYLGTFTYYAAIFTALVGIQEKNGFLSCKYTVTQADYDPAVHYLDLPTGCRVSNGLGLVILATALFATFALANMHTNTHPMADEADHPGEAALLLKQP